MRRRFELQKKTKETRQYGGDLVDQEIQTGTALFEFDTTKGGLNIEKIAPLSRNVPAHEEAMRIYSKLLKTDPDGMKALDLQQIDDRIASARGRLDKGNTYPESTADVRHFVDNVGPTIKKFIRGA